MEEQVVEYNGLVFSDLPGCGTQNFPKQEYVAKFNLANFDCVIIVTADRFYADDLYLIQELNKVNRPVYLVRSKIDFAIERGKKRDIPAEETSLNIYNDLKSQLGDNYNKVEGVYLTSADEPNKYDLSRLLLKINSSLSEIGQKRFIANVNVTSKEVLLKKRELAESIVMKYSALAAANGINPVPGADVGVDMGILYKMTQTIMDIYGLTKEHQSYIKTTLGAKVITISLTKRLAEFALKYGGKEAIMILLKKLAGKVAIKETSKLIPFIGQVIAAGIGCQMTYSMGKSMISEAEGLAKEIFNNIKKI